MSLKKLGRYDLIRVLGRGAMGLVYEGRDPNLDRRVAIKTIKVENLSDEAAAEYEVRFRVEARSAARLQHPNIVSVYDSDRDLDIAYLVMEFVQGDDLKHHLDKGEVYTLKQTLSIMADLLSALSYAHQQGVVHRDIKPANLLVIAGGRIKLADFGVARIQDSGDVTRTQGTIVGTLKYMSPEQLEGKPIDARTDLFAAGVVLYQLVTGQRPFDGDTDFAVIQKIVGHLPAAPTSFNNKLPPALDAVVAKALAKSRDARYANAQEFADALQAACKQARDITIAPTVILPSRSSNTTWTATMMPGESLVTTHSGVSTNSGTSASLVTQEVELVYWKDIKDSNDIEDLQGFLNKFPAGIYGDLARRRLRNLGVSTSADVSETTQLMVRVPMTDAEANDKTVLLPKTEAAFPDASSPATLLAPESVALTASDLKTEVKAAAGQAISATELKPKATPVPVPVPVAVAVAEPVPVPVPVPVPSSAPVPPPAPAKKSSTAWVVAAAVIAVAGIAFKMMSGSQPAADAVSQAPGPALAASAAASSAMGAASSAAVALPVVASSSTVAGVASVATLSTATTASPAPNATASAAVLPASKPARPASAASKASNAVVAKKPTADNERPASRDQAVVSESAATSAPSKTAAAAAAPATNPRAVCEDRALFGFQTCMTEQCAKPGFTQHPTCIERRAMDERRRESERYR